MSHAVRLITQTAWASGGQLGQMILSLVSMTIMVRILGADTYGLYALGLLFLGLAEIFTGGHTADVLVQKKYVREGHKNALVAGLTFIACVASIFLWLGGDVAQAFFETPQLAGLCAGIIPLVFLKAWQSVPLQLLVRETKFDLLTKINLFSGVVASISGIVLAYAGMGVWSLVGMETLRRSLGLFLSLTMLKWWPGIAFTLEDFKDVVSFAARRIENTGVKYFAADAVPRFVIGTALSTTELGYYTVVARLLTQVRGLFTGAVSSVSLPAAAELQDDLNKLWRLVGTIIRLMSWIVVPAAFGLIIVAPQLLPLMFGSDWEGTVLIMQILALGMLRAPMVASSTSYLTACNDLRPITYIQIWAGIFSVIFCTFGIQYGLAGLALAVVARQFLMWPIIVYYISRATKMPPARQFRIYCKAVLPALGMFAGLLCLQPLLSLPAFPLIIVLGLNVCFGILLHAIFWLVINPQNFQLIKTFVRHLASGNVSEAKHCLKSLLALQITYN